MRKFFVSLLTLVSIYTAPAMAAWDWMKWAGGGNQSPLTLQEACANAFVNKAPMDFAAHQTKDFLIYKQDRTKTFGRKLPAPVEPIRVETTLFDIFYGFRFWWVPGNEWHVLIMRDQPERGLSMQADAHKDGIRIPSINEKPELEGPQLNIPATLPPVRAEEQANPDVPQDPSTPKETTPVNPPPMDVGTTPVRDEKIEAPVDQPAEQTQQTETAPDNPQ